MDELNDYINSQEEHLNQLTNFSFELEEKEND